MGGGSAGVEGGGRLNSLLIACAVAAFAVAVIYGTAHSRRLKKAARRRAISDRGWRVDRAGTVASRARGPP